jgi:hypothetical protein
MHCCVNDPPGIMMWRTHKGEVLRTPIAAALGQDRNLFADLCIKMFG